MHLQKSKLETIINKIEEYNTIVVFRHQAPDFDALGTQFGLTNWLRTNFPNKRIYAVGTSNVVLGNNLFPDNDVVSDEELSKEPYLSIVLDTSNASRISDERWNKGGYIIKIDHHPQGDNYGNLNLVRTSAAAASELVYAVISSKTFKKYKIDENAARFIMAGIVGDTGRFQFSSTTTYTLKAASELLKRNFNLQKDVYVPMYNKDLKDLEINKKILNNYGISKHGVAYYHLSSETLKELGLDSDEGKAYLHLFATYDQILVWCAFCQDERSNTWRGSLRSRDIVINKIAGNHNGGGHACASGCRMDTYEETLQVVEELDKYLEELGY